MERVPRRAVQIGVDGTLLEGTLTLPPEATEVAVLINGDWGVRFASRETDIAEELNRREVGTLLVELLTPEEAADRSTRSAVDVLADRLAGVAEWLDHHERAAGLAPGLFGVGPGGATALRAVARHGVDVDAVVALDGRIDLVEDVLGDVAVPTLLIVNGANEHLVPINQAARRAFVGEDHHCTVLWADDDGAMDSVNAEVASLAAGWFETHLDGER